jgi:hypothetical protein
MKNLKICDFKPKYTTHVLKKRTQIFEEGVGKKQTI